MRALWSDRQNCSHNVSQKVKRIMRFSDYVPSVLPGKQAPWLGHTPSTAGTFRRKFRKNSGKTPETLSERFLEFPSRVRLGCPKPYNSRHLRLPERFQNYLPPSTAGDASFFRIGSREGISELVMEFPAVLGVFLNGGTPEF